MTKNGPENQQSQEEPNKEQAVAQENDLAQEAQSAETSNEEQKAPPAKKKSAKEDDFQTLTTQKVSLEQEALEQEVTALKNLNQTLEEKIRSEGERYVRLLADFDNFKKRSRQEAELRAKFSHQPFAEELIKCLDDLEIAVKHMSKDEQLQKSGAVSGLQMSLNKFAGMLSSFGIEKIQAEQQKFDPNLHEAVGVVSGTTENDNTIQTEVQAGYRIHERILRPTKVIVAQHKEN